MLKLPPIILTELSKQTITRAVTPADCGKRKILACWGKELTCSDDSRVKELVVSSQSSAAGSTGLPSAAPGPQPGCWLRRVLCSCALPCSTTVRHAWKLSSFQVLAVVFQRCLKSWRLHTQLQKNSKETNQSPKNIKKTFTEKNVANCNESFPLPPLSRWNSTLGFALSIGNSAQLGSEFTTQMTLHSAHVL